MKYMGSKSRIAKHLVPIIQGYLNRHEYSFYLEPFCGGCNIIDKINHPRRIASDKQHYLIELFGKLHRLSELPDDFVTREHYNDVRNSYNAKDGRYEDWYIGAIGFLASYNGRFFDGGYAGTSEENGRVRNYYDETFRNLKEQVPNLLKLDFYERDYIEWDVEDCLIYCDPPYKGTKQYDISKNFDHEKFWDWCRKMSEKNTVLISEESAPDDFECIWEQPVTRTIKTNDKQIKVEKLFKYRGERVTKDIDIYNNDCLVVMDELVEKDVKVDAIITDPPYGINYTSYRTGRGNLMNDDNLNWVDEFCELCACVLKHGHHLYCFVDPEYSAEFVMGFRKYGFKIRNFLTIPRAVKGNGGERIFQQQFEFCIFATLGSADEGRKFNQTQILAPSEGYKKDKRYNAKEWLYRLPDCWSWTTASEHNSNNIYHPTQKNVECIKDMLRISTNEGEVVLDPCMGSGTTGVACRSLGRKFIGIELDEKYFNVAKSRLEKPAEIELF